MATLIQKKTFQLKTIEDCIEVDALGIRGFQLCSVYPQSPIRAHNGDYEERKTISGPQPCFSLSVCHCGHGNTGLMMSCVCP